MSKSKPPEICIDATEMPSRRRICWPKKANTARTTRDVRVACHAALFRSFGVILAVSDMKTGRFPAGSAMTKTVVNVVKKRLASNAVTA